MSLSDGGYVNGSNYKDGIRLYFSSQPGQQFTRADVTYQGSDGSESGIYDFYLDDVRIGSQNIRYYNTDAASRGDKFVYGSDWGAQYRTIIDISIPLNVLLAQGKTSAILRPVMLQPNGNWSGTYNGIVTIPPSIEGNYSMPYNPIIPTVVRPGNPPSSPTTPGKPSEIWILHLKTPVNPNIPGVLIDAARWSLNKGGWGLDNYYKVNDGYEFQLEKYGSFGFDDAAFVVIIVLAILVGVIAWEWRAIKDDQVIMSTQNNATTLKNKCSDLYAQGFLTKDQYDTCIANADQQLAAATAAQQQSGSNILGGLNLSTIALFVVIYFAMKD
jgi:hypothetical protein